MLRSSSSTLCAVAIASALTLTSSETLRADGHTSAKDIIDLPQGAVAIDHVPVDDVAVSLKDVEIVEAASPFYIGLKGSIGFVNETEFNTLGTTVETDYDTAFLGSVSVGYDLKQGASRGFRAELEFGGLRSAVDGHTVGGTAFASEDSTGTASGFYGFANLFYDIGIGRYGAYAGLGIGVAHMDIARYGVTPTATVLDDSATGLALQAMAGLTMRVTERTHLDLGYAYQSVTGLEVTAMDGTRSTLDVDNHAITIGFRLSL